MERKKGYKKTTKAEMRIRYNIIQDFLTKGMDRLKIMKYIEEKTDWGIGFSSLDKYIMKVNQEIDAAEAPRRDREKIKADMNLRNLMCKSELIQDYRTAAKIQGQICELWGLNSPRGIELSGNVDTLIKYDYTKLSTEELKRLLELAVKAKKDDGKP